jgi:demethylmenaquinone methyltransferase/2-methoxy-6-polyprenyl-1,4-benzoquinol methylase
MQTALRERPKTPQAVFDRVAPYYDLFNGLLSLGIDRSWRRGTSRALALAPGDQVLDVATGTGALAAALAQTSANVTIIGCDLNRSMLGVAQKRVLRANLPVQLILSDAARLPFPDSSFDAVTMAFAIDDMPDRRACAAEMLRVLRPSGKLALLELSRPDQEPMRSLYRAYLSTFNLLRRFRVQGYDHLAQEILTYRGANAARELLLEQGFVEYETRSFTFGLSRLHLARRPASGSPGDSLAKSGSRQPGR